MKKSSGKARDILQARYALLGDGRVRIHYNGIKAETALDVGPGYQATVSQRVGDTFTEATFGCARIGAAYIRTLVKSRPGEIRRKVETTFASRTVRTDDLDVRGNQIAHRSVKWKYKDGSQILATYGPGSRKMSVSPTGRGEIELLTTSESFGPVIRSATEFGKGAAGTSDPPVMIGDTTIGVGKSTTFIGQVPAMRPNQDPGPFTYATVSTREDGTIVSTEVTPFKNGIGAGQLTTNYGTLETTSTYSITTREPDGTTTVVSQSFELHGDGTYSSTLGFASTNTEGGFQTYTEASEGGQLTERTSYANDGQGNESETTVTYGDDGSYTITTISKDSEGNTTTNSESFDADGNPTQSGNDDKGDDDKGDNDDGDDKGDDDTDDGSGDDEEGDDTGGGGGESEYPTDDGTDPSPGPQGDSNAQAALLTWLLRFDPSLSGVRSKFNMGGPRNPGDPPPLARFAFGMSDEWNEPTMTTGTSTLEGATFDLRMYLNREPDPENHPQALISALMSLGLLGKAGQRAAQAAVEHMAAS